MHSQKIKLRDSSSIIMHSVISQRGHGARLSATPLEWLRKHYFIVLLGNADNLGFPIEPMTIPDVIAPARTVHLGLNARLAQARRAGGFMNQWRRLGGDSERLGISEATDEQDRLSIYRYR
jgi:hypothetical protein